MLLINQITAVQINDVAEHVENRDSDIFLVFPNISKRRLVAACAQDKLPPTSLAVGTRGSSSLFPCKNLSDLVTVIWLLTAFSKLEGVSSKNVSCNYFTKQYKIPRNGYSMCRLCFPDEAGVKKLAISYGLDDIARRWSYEELLERTGHFGLQRQDSYIVVLPVEH